MKIQVRELKCFCILLRWFLLLDKKEAGSAASDRLCEGWSMRWDYRWRNSAKYFSQGETHDGEIAQRERWVRGILVLKEEGWCKRVEQQQRESEVIASGGTTSR